MGFKYSRGNIMNEEIKEELKEEVKIVTIELSTLSGLPCLNVTGDHIAEFYSIWHGMVTAAKAEAIEELIRTCIEKEKTILANEIREVLKP